MVIRPKDLPFPPGPSVSAVTEQRCPTWTGERTVRVRREQGQKKVRGTGTPREVCTTLSCVPMGLGSHLPQHLGLLTSFCPACDCSCHSLQIPSTPRCTPTLSEPPGKAPALNTCMSSFLPCPLWLEKKTQTRLWGHKCQIPPHDLTKANSSTCSGNPIASLLLRNYADTFVPVLSSVHSWSFFIGSFPGPPDSL